MPKKLVSRFSCPAELAIAILSGKWTATILCHVLQRPRRYAELRKLIAGLSDKVLTQRLSELTRLGLVTLRRTDETSGVSAYDVTPLACSLRDPLEVLHHWGRDYAEGVGVDFEGRLGALSHSPALSAFDATAGDGLRGVNSKHLRKGNAVFRSKLRTR